MASLPYLSPDATPSPTEILRRAAALMRERAAGALPCYSAESGETMHRGGCGECPWHPTLALAVADLLDDEAQLCEETGDRPYDYALAVARAYLGESA